MQKEDVDLAWRLRRLGWEAWYEPSALAWHARTGIGPAAPGMSEIARANMTNDVRERTRSWRNQRLMQVKNERTSDLLRDLPWIAWREFLEWGFLVLLDARRLRAVPELLRALPWAMRKRRALAILLARRPDPR
jgi:GT2 family glycosyltransferase